MGGVGGESCPIKEGGPSNVKVELLSPSGDLVSSVQTSSGGSYLFTNIIPGEKVSKLLSQEIYIVVLYLAAILEHD